MTLPNTMPNLAGLLELGQRDGVDIRPTLLRVMTDLYVSKPMHSADEERHFTELALRLIDLVDARTRAIVTEKIAGYAGAPPTVRQRLLRDHIAVKTAEHTLTRTSAQPSPDELSELFLAANADERRLILLNLPYAPLQPAQAIPAAAARETIHRLEAAALGHNTEVFARELERTLAISRALARRLIEDASGEAIVVVAAVLKMPAAVLQRVLLCLNPAISQSVQRVYELALLHEEIEPEAALRLLALWQASHPARRGDPDRAAAHHPHYAPDAPERAASAAPAAPPAARPQIRWDEHARNRRESA